MAFVNFITLITLRWFGQFITSSQLFLAIRLIAFLYISNSKCTGAELWNSQTEFKLKKKTLQPFQEILSFEKFTQTLNHHIIVRYQSHIAVLRYCDYYFMQYSSNRKHTRQWAFMTAAELIVWNNSSLSCRRAVARSTHISTWAFMTAAELIVLNSLSFSCNTAVTRSTFIPTWRIPRIFWYILLN